MRPLFLIALLIISFSLPSAAASADELKTITEKAEKGDASSQATLGAFYSVGGLPGVPQDYAKAIKWSRKAAEQGNASAQSLLGVYYDNGWGIPQDYAEAAKWYRMAAVQGDSLAQEYLGDLYAQGHGVPLDNEEAYAWLSVAVAQGNDHATKMRDLVAIYLNETDLSRAQQLSKRYFANYAKHRSDASP